MEREDGHKVRVSGCRGVDRRSCWAIPRDGYFLVVRDGVLELSKMVPLRPRGRSELRFSQKAGRSGEGLYWTRGALIWRGWFRQVAWIQPGCSSGLFH